MRTYGEWKYEHEDKVPVRNYVITHHGMKTWERRCKRKGNNPGLN
jgi:hypothetical protein